MSAPYTLDIAVSTNEDWRDALSFVSGSPAEPVDLTGHAFEMHLRAAAGDKYTILALSTANGRLVVSAPATGVLAIDVDIATMRSLAPGTYVHDLVMTVSGSPRRIAQGSVVISEGVTR